MSLDKTILSQTVAQLVERVQEIAGSRPGHSKNFIKHVASCLIAWRLIL